MLKLQARNNFATDVITNTCARSGRGSGMPDPGDDVVKNDCKVIREAAIKDGLIPTPNNSLGKYDGDREKCHFLAVLVGEADYPIDHHWFRFMRPGTEKVFRPLCFHKSGFAPPTDKDFSGKPIGYYGNISTKDKF